MAKEFGSFRKATFGFNRKDVIAYIEKMRNESYEYKKQVEDTVNSLNEKIRELENAARLMDEAVPAEKADTEKGITAEGCKDIGQATKHLKTVADELCRSLGDFMDKLSEKGLFDAAAQPEQVTAAAEKISEEESVSLVDGILASISYLGTQDAEIEKAEKKPEAVREADVSAILSGFAFID